MGEIGGNLILQATDNSFFEKGKLGEKAKTPIFCTYVNHRFTLSYVFTHTNFHFHRNKDNVQSSFSSTACGGKHALQLRFSAKTDSAFNPKLPFRTGSKPESWFRHGKLQFL